MFRIPIVVAIAIATTVPFAFAADRASDAKIRQRMIEESIESYPGTCPCPYNVARNGSSCGRRSAYNRPGGYSPLCYSTDITNAMVEAYRREHGY